MTLDLTKDIKRHEDELERLKAKQLRADKLWREILAPLSSEDRKLAFEILQVKFDEGRP